MTIASQAEEPAGGGEDQDVAEPIAAFVSEIGEADAGALVERLEALADDDPPPPGIGDRIGRYRILDVLGQGGMGIVYKAEQAEPIRRLVALKLVREPATSAWTAARFLGEQQVLARLEHPNIARIYDAAVDGQGRSFFAMELVEGVSITNYCERERLDLRSRIRLFIRVCHAVQHAHQKGVLHRDLSPANILVTTGEPVGVPKVIDFGLAQLLSTGATGDADDSTVASMRWRGPVGTLEYMSPEQSCDSEDGIDTRSDVFALGVILHQLLAGELPWGRDDAQRSLTERLAARRALQPDRPSALVARRRDEAAAANCRTTARERSRRLRGELDAIILRAVASRRADRYSSVHELANDLAAHLDHRPVAAAPAGFAGTVAKLMRRHRNASLAVVLVALALLVGLAVSTHFLIKLTATQGQLSRKVAESRRIRDYLEQIIGSPSRFEYADADPRLGEVLRREERGIAATFADLPVVQAGIRNLFGRVYLKIGDPAAALAQYETARDLLDEFASRMRAASPPQKSAELAEAAGIRHMCVDGLTAALIALHRPAEAEAMLEELLASDDPPSNQVLLSWLDGLARARESLGKYQLAEESYRRAIELERQVAGVRAGRGSGVTRAVESLMRFLLAQGRPAEVLEIFERSESSGATLPLRRGANQAMLRGLAQLRCGDFAAAEDELYDALKTISPSLPDHHPRTREILAALVEFHTARDAPGDAERAAEFQARIDGVRR